MWDKSLAKRDIATGTSLYSVPAEFGFDGWTDSERDRLYLLDTNEMDLIAYRMMDRVRLGVEFRFGEDASYIPEGELKDVKGKVIRPALKNPVNEQDRHGKRWRDEENFDGIIANSSGCGGDFSLEPTGSEAGKTAGRHDAGGCGER